MQAAGEREQESVGVELATLLNQRYTPEVMSRFPGDEPLWQSHLRDLGPARVRQLQHEVECLISLDEVVAFGVVNRLYQQGESFISPPEELSSWLREFDAYLAKYDKETFRQHDVSDRDAIVLSYYTTFFTFVAIGATVLLLAFLKSLYSTREEAVVAPLIAYIGVALLAYPVLFVPLYHRFGDDIRTRFLLYSRRLAWTEVERVTWQSNSVRVSSILTAGIALLKPQFTLLVLDLTSGRQRSMPCDSDTAATISNLWRRHRADRAGDNPFQGIAPITSGNAADRKTDHAL